MITLIPRDGETSAYAGAKSGLIALGVILFGLPLFLIHQLKKYREKRNGTF